MRKKLLMVGISLLMCCAWVGAQETGKNELQQRAESEYAKGNPIAARALYIKAFESYVNGGNLKQGVDCGVKGNKLYYEKENLYKEAFDLLRRIDQTIEAKGQGANKAALHYWTTKERHLMYMKMRKMESAKEQMKNMENHAQAANDAAVKNDLLYTKTIYYYTVGQSEKGNATFKEMADQLTASKEYGKVDEVYQTLIANGRKSNSASLVAESYKSYMAWKDSASALVLADTVGVLKKQIADNEAEIDEKDSSLTARQAAIVGLGILAAVLAAALVLGAIVLMRYMYSNRKQKKTIKLLNENNALKAKFISSISAQLAPTLQKLDKGTPEVKALLDFSEHIQTLSELENAAEETVEKEDVQVGTLCEGLMEQIQGKVKSGVKASAVLPDTNLVVADLYSKPFVYVYNSHDHSAYYKNMVHTIQGDYKEYMNTDLPLITEDEVDEKMLKSKNVFLIGHVFENPLLVELVDSVKREESDLIDEKRSSISIHRNTLTQKLFVISSFTSQDASYFKYPWIDGMERVLKSDSQ